MSKPTKTKSNLSRKLLFVLPAVSLTIIAALLVAASIESHRVDAVGPASASMDLTVQAESLSIDLSSTSVVLDVAPTFAGQFESTNPVTINVDTTNTYGYNLVMTATTTTSLTGTVPLSDGTTYPTIATLGDNNGGSGYDATNFPNNRWGYAVNGSNFLPVANTTTLRTTDGTNNISDRSNSLSFATKLNTEITTGNYNITLNFVATTNSPSNLEDFDAAFIFAGKTKYNGYYKMQDMTANICSYVATPTTTTSAPSTQLIDTRDNKIYWIAKLIDGKCWMTQNLDLDLSTSTALTSNDTDLNVIGSAPYLQADGYSQSGSVISWTPESNTITTIADGKFSGYTNDYNNPYSADRGNWYWYPKQVNSAIYNSETYCAGDFGCNYLSKNGSWADYFTQTMNGLSGQTNGMHGHVGNYYNWSAAVASNNTAGVAPSNTDTNVGNSICPKNWRLAVGADNNTNDYKLVNNYYNGGLTGESSSVNDNGLVSSPLYFVRGGYVDDGTLYYAGRSGSYWSSTVYSSTYARYLYFRTGYVYPANGYGGRHGGWFVRCIARTSISDITYMQEFATMTDAKKEEVKNTMVTGQAYQLIDNRDNEVYNVAKLADGNVWLLDNLRLDPAALLHQLTPANTNMDPSTPFTLPESSTTGFEDSTAGWTEPHLNTSLKDSNAIYRADYTGPIGKIGTFYNYCAASAGTICAPKGENTSNANYDVCPSGWSMPLGTQENKSYYYLLNTAYQNNATLFTNAIRAVIKAAFWNGVTHIGGYSGTWSSTHISDINTDKMLYLWVAPDSVYPQSSDTRQGGFFVRCLLK